MKNSHLILLILIMAVVAYGGFVPEVIPDPLRPIFAILFFFECCSLPIVWLIVYGVVMDAIWRVAKYGNGVHPFVRKICIALVKDHL